MKYNRPFLLKPVGKDYLWGGDRLNSLFHKGIELTPLAETWECSTHADGLSIVSSGEFVGQTLKQVLKNNKQLLGAFANDEGELPILIKFIDAKQDLSVQVHPDDGYALQRENGQKGKSEMWYVVDAQPNTQIVYGLNKSVDKASFAQSIAEGTVERYLRRVDVNKGDMFYIEAGTLHAIGKGALIAEVQESSNLTYRVYDYQRRDVHGKLRQLHIDKALDVTSLQPTQLHNSCGIVSQFKGYTQEMICSCKYFDVLRLIVDTTTESDQLSIDDTAFAVLLCVEGSGSIVYEGEQLAFSGGDCVFVPAQSCAIALRGNATLLKVSCRR